MNSREYFAVPASHDIPGSFLTISNHIVKGRKQWSASLICPCDDVEVHQILHNKHFKGNVNEQDLRVVLKQGFVFQSYSPDVWTFTKPLPFPICSSYSAEC